MVLSPSMNSYHCLFNHQLGLFLPYVHSLTSGSTRTEQEYIEAAQALGIQSWRIVGFHVLPQAAPLLIWAFAAGVPAAVFAEASISFSSA